MYQRIKKSLAYRHSDTLEPGILRIFRAYIIVMDAIVGFSILIVLFEGLIMDYTLYLYGVAFLILLNFLVLNNSFHKRYGNGFLAISLALFVIMSTLFLWATLHNDMPEKLYEWLPLYFRFGFTLLFIPFIITAWQFGLLGTFTFISMATLSEIAIFLLMLNDTPLLYMIGFSLFRSMNYFVVGSVISRLMLAQRKQRYELTMANQQLTHYASTLEQLSTSRERNRLARELHDTLAHTLSGVSVQLEAVRALWNTRPNEAQKMLNQALSDTRHGLTDTRRALEDLRIEPLEDLGLKLALEQLCIAFNERTGIEISIDLPDALNITALSVAAQNCIYRTVQEALANIDRHAAARLVTLGLTYSAEENQLILCITDDGRGFDLGEKPEEGHFGLRGIRERAELIGGTCEINSQPGEGTTITLLLKENLQ